MEDNILSEFPPQGGNYFESHSGDDIVGKVVHDISLEAIARAGHSDDSEIEDFIAISLSGLRAVAMEYSGSKTVSHETARRYATRLGEFVLSSGFNIVEVAKRENVKLKKTDLNNEFQFMIRLHNATWPDDGISKLGRAIKYAAQQCLGDATKLEAFFMNTSLRQCMKEAQEARKATNALKPKAPSIPLEGISPALIGTFIIKIEITKGKGKFIEFIEPYA